MWRIKINNKFLQRSLVCFVLACIFNMLFLTVSYADSTSQQETTSQTKLHQKDSLSTLFDNLLNVLNVWSDTAEKVKEDEEIQTSWEKIKKKFKNAFSSASDQIENDQEIKTSSRKIVDVFKKAFSSVEKEIENDDQIMASLYSLNETLQQANKDIFGKIEQPSNTQTTSRQTITPYDNNKILELLPSYTSLEEINQIADFADYAVLAWAAYGDNEAIDLAKSRGWKPFYNEVDFNLIEGDTTGVLFISSRGKHVFAFRGTDTNSLKNFVQDALSDIAVFDPTPITNKQAAGARKIADKIFARHSDVIFVGHSLGGRLAKVARYKTGNVAVAFNSAPLSLNDSWGAATRMTIEKAEGFNFRSPKDPVTSGYETLFNSIAVKNTHISKNPLENHSMNNLALAMQEVRQVRESNRNY